MCVQKRGTQTLGATDRDWYFEETTVQSAIELTRYLMKKYNIPADHVIRHYDVTGKICPNPYVYNTGTYTWDAFKKSISGQNGDILPATDKPWITVSARHGGTPAARSERFRRSRKPSSVQISMPVIMSTMIPEGKYTHQVRSHTRYSPKTTTFQSGQDRPKHTVLPEHFCSQVSTRS